MNTQRHATLGLVLLILGTVAGCASQEVRYVVVDRCPLCYGTRHSAIALDHTRKKGYFFDKQEELQAPDSRWQWRGPKNPFDTCPHQWAREKRVRIAHISIERKREVKPELCKAVAEAIRSSRDPAIRETAVVVAANLATPQLKHVLLDALKDPSEPIRVVAAEALADDPPEESYDWFLEAARSKNVMYRLVGARALGQIRTEQSLAQLTEMVKDNDPFVRTEAALSLGQHRNPKAGPPLGQILVDPISDVAQQGVRSLIAMCFWEDEHKVAAHEITEEERRNALACRGAAVEACLSALTAVPADARARGAETLLTIIEKTYVAEMVATEFTRRFQYVQQDEGFPVIPSAAVAAEQQLARQTRDLMVKANAAARLTKVADDRDFHVRRAALKNLYWLGSSEIEDVVARGLRGSDRTAATLCAEVLERYGTSASVTALLEAARDDRYSVAARAIRALSRHESRRIFLTFLDAMESPDPRVRIAASQALAVQARKVTGADLDGRRRLERMLVPFRSRIAGTLIKGLADVTPDVRMASSVALSHLGSRDAIPHLIDRLEDEHARVRMEAAIALRRLVQRYYAQQDFSFHPVGAAKYREEAIERWRAWWAKVEAEDAARKKAREQEGKAPASDVPAPKTD